MGANRGSFPIFLAGYYVGKISGVISVRFSRKTVKGKGRGGGFQISKISMLASALWCIYLGSILYTIVSRRAGCISRGGCIWTLLLASFTVFNMSIVFVSVLVRPNRTVGFCRDLVRFYRAVERRGGVPPSSSVLPTFLLSFVFVSGFVLRGINNARNSSLKPHVAFVMESVRIFPIFADLTLVFLLRFFQLVFRHINARLGERPGIKSLLVLHTFGCRVLRDFSACFGLDLGLSVLQKFVHIMGLINYFVAKSGSAITLDKMGSLLIPLLLFSLLCIQSEHLKNEVLKTRHILRTTMTNKSSTPEQVILFYNSFKSREIRITAQNFFNVDLALLIQVFSLLCMYTVTIIQNKLDARSH